MIIDKYVNIKVSSKSLEHYKKLGYEFKKNLDIIKVDVKDLTKNSSVKVKVSCDVCGKIKTIKYSTYTECLKTGNIYACNDCSRIKKFKDFNNEMRNKYKRISKPLINFESKIQLYEYLKKNKGEVKNVLNFPEKYPILKNKNINNIRELFMFLQNLEEKDIKCRNVKCNNVTDFIGFSNTKRYPRGFKNYCCEKCLYEMRSIRQMGDDNTYHRMNPDKIPEFRKKLSDSMKDRIASGKFKPNIHNSWRNTKYLVLINGIIKKFRSSWEAFFNLVNPSFSYESRRIPYVQNDEKHTYIVDFDDIENRILYEIKPISLENTERNLIKKNVL